MKFSTSNRVRPMRLLSALADDGGDRGLIDATALLIAVA
jgi:hypothetical protein